MIEDVLELIMIHNYSKQCCVGAFAKHNYSKLVWLQGKLFCNLGKRRGAYNSIIQSSTTKCFNVNSYRCKSVVDDGKIPENPSLIHFTLHLPFDNVSLLARHVQELSSCVY